MRLRTIVALICVILGLLPACGGAQGGAYPIAAKRDYRSAGDTSPENGYVVDGLEMQTSLTSSPASAEEITVAGSGEAGGENFSDDDSGGSAGDFKPTALVQPAPPPPPAPAPPKDTATPPAKEAPGKVVAEPPPPGAAGKKAGGDDKVSVMVTPMLVYTARVNMAVYEVRNSLAEVESLARNVGGFLARRNDQSITIRVPVSRFDEAIKRIEKLGDMLSRDVQVEDVTEEFHDTEIRLRNARAVRERLEQLLAKATKVEESIQIERELERIAELIDRLEGRVKFLRDRAAFSTITVTFQPRSSTQLGKRPFNLPVPWLYDIGLGRLLSL
jgi:hypothetical protein